MSLPVWASRDDGWFARVAMAAAALVGVLTTAGALGGGAGRAEVALLSAVTVAGIAANDRWRLPPLVLAVWTFTPAIVLNLQERGEGTMFLLVVALSYFVNVTPGRRARVAAGTVAVLVPAGVQAAVQPDWGWPFWTAGMVVTWLTAEQMRRFRSVVVELLATRELLADQAVNVERRRIAAEVHDLVGHSLTVLLLHITGARRRLPDDPTSAARALEEAESIGRASLADIRRSMVALRDRSGNDLAPTPTAADVPLLVAHTAGSGVDVTLGLTGALDEVDGVLGLAVYRVVQESLVNATRHAPGAAVRVSVDVQEEAVRVEVQDTGGPAPTAANGGAADGGVGLVGMRERVQVLGGTLDAGNAQGGWVVRVLLPRSGPGAAPLEREPTSATSELPG